MQASIVFSLRVQCRRKESSRSLSHLLMSFLLLFLGKDSRISQARSGSDRSLLCSQWRYGMVVTWRRRYTKLTQTWRTCLSCTDQSSWQVLTCATRAGNGGVLHGTSGCLTGTRTTTGNMSVSWTPIIVCFCSAATWPPSTAQFILNRCALLIWLTWSAHVSTSDRHADTSSALKQLLL